MKRSLKGDWMDSEKQERIRIEEIFDFIHVSNSRKVENRVLVLLVELDKLRMEKIRGGRENRSIISVHRERTRRRGEKILHMQGIGDKGGGLTRAMVNREEGVVSKRGRNRLRSREGRMTFVQKEGDNIRIGGVDSIVHGSITFIVLYKD